MNRVTHQYRVRYEYQKSDNYWTRAELFYDGVNKKCHKGIEKRWRRDMQNQKRKVSLISVDYC